MGRIKLNLRPVGITATNCSYEARFVEEMITELRAFLASEPQEPFQVRYPKSWWQHFKSRFFPPWLAARFPVEWETVKADVATVYPFLKSALPLEVMGPTVIVCVADRHSFSFLPECGVPPTVWNYEALELIAKKHADYRKCPCCGRAWFRE